MGVGRVITAEERNRVASIEEMKATGDKWVICNVLREIYQLAEKIDDPKAREIMEWVRTAYVMAKRMNIALKNSNNPLEVDWKDKKDKNTYGV